MPSAPCRPGLALKLFALFSCLLMAVGLAVTIAYTAAVAENLTLLWTDGPSSAPVPVAASPRGANVLFLTAALASTFELGRLIGQIETERP